ncbi:unnamed protein product [Coregonus sp. 'balchen']|nr:unnamed protein product [Coregonus sp. 'balchen']
MFQAFYVLMKVGIFHLNIYSTKQEDVGMYYCGLVRLNFIEFGPGTTLMLKVQPGDSVTLKCTIHTETCVGEHSVYWFSHGSGESRPGIIYTHGDRSDQCVKSPEVGSPTQSCVYNLPKKNLSLSDARTYYCAVASCGDTFQSTILHLISPTVLALVVSNIVLGIVTLLLVWNQDSDVLNYAAVSFTPKKNSSSSRRAREKTSREDAVYSEVRHLQQQ